MYRVNRCRDDDNASAGVVLASTSELCPFRTPAAAANRLLLLRFEPAEQEGDQERRRQGEMLGFGRSFVLEDVTGAGH